MGVKSGTGKNDPMQDVAPSISLQCDCTGLDMALGLDKSGHNTLRSLVACFGDLVLS